MSQEEITPTEQTTPEPIAASPPATETPSSPPPVIAPTTPEPQKKYVKREITWVGRTDGTNACGGCQDLNHFFNAELVPGSDVPTEVKKVDIDSPEGIQIKTENNLKYIPFAKECLISSDPEKPPECKTVNRYDKADWKIKVNE